MKPPKVVGEACCNHMGNFDIAIKMIKIAKECGVDYVKFQKRDPELSIPPKFMSKPHPVVENAYGKTYFEHRVALEFTIEQHKALQGECEKIGVGYSSSVWDCHSASDIISLNPDFIKVPSTANTNFEMLDMLFNEYGGDIHISLGMMTRMEREHLEIRLEKEIDRIVVYWTTSGYPVPFSELYLLEIESLNKTYERVGYSGHNLGIAVDIAAYTLGAEWVERHFTIDRTWKGTDQAASLEPIGLKKVVRDLKATHLALKLKNIEMTEDEKMNREKLKIDGRSIS